MPTFSLIPHPDAPPRGVSAVSVGIEPIGGRQAAYRATFDVVHDGSLLLPPMRDPARADELWKTTCCEVFVMPDGGNDYIEFNLSPSSCWAAYGFDGYRAGMHNVDLTYTPDVQAAAGQDGLQLSAQLDLASLASLDARMNLTAVIEEIDGTKSFWALAHAVEVPDFHNADCFVARLPAPAAS